MDPIKVVARVDVVAGRVVFGVRLTDWQDAGGMAPMSMFLQRAAPEGVLAIDRDGLPSGRVPEWVETAVHELQKVPMCVAGGLASIDDARALLAAGASQVGFEWGVEGVDELISLAVAEFGAAHVAVVIEGSPQLDQPSGYEVVVGGRALGLDCAEAAARAAELGVGTVYATSIEVDGVGSGFDLDFAAMMVAAAGDTPVIVGGGAGQVEDFFPVIDGTKAAGAMAAKSFHDRSVSIHEVREDLLLRGLFIKRPEPGPATGGH